MSLPVLRAKLLIPELTDKHIARERLKARLMKDFGLARHFTLACAPAGYGKTTLIREVIGDMQQPCVWITLDESDNDINRFLTYLIYGLRKTGIKLGEDEAYLISDANPAAAGVLVADILNCIVEKEEQIILVLDDYHTIHEQQINQLLSTLLEHQPPNLSLVMATRQDPPFPVSRLRVAGRMTEVRMQDLCFSSEETGTFLTKALGWDVSPELSAQIAQTTEGWAAGMQLAGLMLAGMSEGQAQEAVGRFSGTHRYSIDYLVEEVLRKQPEEIQRFLCQTSIFERMNAGLCQAVTGRADSAELLHQLKKANLFLSPMDLCDEWYRYHQLFAEALRMTLPPQEEPMLYQKAALWMMDSGYYHEAVSYAFQAQDPALALKMVEQSTERVFRDAQLVSFLHWLDKLPQQMVRESEIVAVRKSIALLATGRVGEALEHLRSLEADYEEHASNHNKGLIYCVRAMVANMTGGDAEHEAQQALMLLEPFDQIARTSMLNIVGKSQFVKGNTVEALHILETAYHTGIAMGYTLITTLVLMNYGLCLNAAGNSGQALEMYEKYLDGMTTKYGKPLPIAGIILVSAAEIYYDRNEIAQAASYLGRGVALCKGISYTWLVSGAVHAYITSATGQREAAITQLSDQVSRVGDTHTIAPEMLIALTHLFLMNGEVSAAERYCGMLDTYGTDITIAVNINIIIARARLLIYQGFLEEANKMLDKAVTTTKQYGRVKSRITALLLRAGICARRGEAENAAASFQQAAELAIPGDYIRLFLDEQPILQDILQLPRLAESTRQQVWLERIRQALPDYSDERRDTAPSKNAGMQLVEKPSEREMDILRLITSGKSNAEISKQLFISINTTQWHISNLYAKLGVRSRTQALIKAKELGLI